MSSSQDANVQPGIPGAILLAFRARHNGKSYLAERPVGWPSVPGKGDQVDIGMTDPRFAIVEQVTWGAEGECRVWLGHIEIDEALLDAADQAEASDALDWWRDALIGKGWRVSDLR